MEHHPRLPKISDGEMARFGLHAASSEWNSNVLINTSVYFP